MKTQTKPMVIVKARYPGIDILNGKTIVVFGDVGDDCGIKGDTPKEAEANAARIVKCVNMHDELVDKMKKLLSLYTDTSNPSVRIFLEVKELLTLASQK